ncbi:hypothetical protein [Virgibacillus sediminis]|uniref:Uncharacterized protein n=1 Tax=Virgibacillus sediminis TaxID=202260 RepID=A0ABV7A400_9BACI
MAKIPVKPILGAVKYYGPKAKNLVKDNWRVAAPVVLQGVESFKKYNENKHQQGKVPFRKLRYAYYNTEVLPNLNNRKKSELFQFKLEIEQFIKQIEEEEEKEVAVKKRIHSKRIIKWKDVLKQIEDKMAVSDYQEYLKIYNNIEYDSQYFEDYEGLINKFKTLIENNDKDKIHSFLLLNTNKSSNEIKKDFFSL